MKKTISIIVLVSVLVSLFCWVEPAEYVVADTSKKMVQLGGEAFGIKMFSDGVMVVAVEDKLIGSDVVSPAVNAGIEVNDVIKSVNSEKILSNEQFTEIVAESVNMPLDLSVERKGKIMNITLTPVSDEQGNPRVGLWIKDSAAGIGTITYYDTENSSIGALGHGICESGTGEIIPLSYGEIANANINSITKSENGKVGSLNGYFDGEIIGQVNKNTDFGIFGSLIINNENEYIEVGKKQEVKLGKAQIYCTVDSEDKKAYDIKIKRLSNCGEEKMVIEITDLELLELTGGIVQGMSGSPIVQNGKLIGAVTHVLVNDVKCGYGIYIEDMMASEE